MVFTLSYGEVVRVLAKMHDFAPAKSTPLRGRVQHLQKLGVPSGVNTGRGRAAAYGRDELFQIAVAFEMLDLGFPPERARLVTTNWDMVRGGILEAATVNPFERVYLVLHPLALNYLRNKEAEPQELATSIFFLRKTMLVDWMNTPATARSTALIDLTAVLYALDDALRSIRPDLHLKEIVSSWHAELFDGDDP